MKMRKLNLILIVLCTLFLNNNVFASNSTVGGNNEIYAQSIKIIDSPRSITVDQSYNLKAVITPSTTTNKNVTWESSDKSILTVDKNGKITGKKRGTVKVTARTSNGKTESISITVRLNNTTTQGKKVSSIAIVDTPKEVLVGNEFQIKTSISPKNVDNPNLTYSSSNTKIIEIDKTGYAKAVGKGTATITVRSSNGKSASIKISVKNIKIVLDKKELKLEKGKTATITASIKAGTKYSAKKVNWSTSSTSIAKAKEKSANENKFTATVTAKSKGTANIVIQIDDEKKSIPIKVTDNTPDYNLECPEISYDISNSKTVKMNLNFKNNIDHWDFYYSTNKSSGSKAKWKKLDTYKGNKEIVQDALNVQGKIIIYSKEGTSRACYTVPYDINYDYYNRRDEYVSINKNQDSNLTCPKIVENAIPIPGTVQIKRSSYSSIIAGTNKVYITVNPYNNKHYQYVHFYNGENRDEYQNKWVGFNGKTTFSLNPNIKDDGTIQGEVVVLDNKGNYKPCYTKSYSNEKFEKVEQVGTTYVYFEKGYQYNDNNMLNIIKNLPSYYLASPNIYFYTSSTYYKKTKSNDSCGIAYSGDMRIYLTDGYNCKEDYMKLAVVHELSHAMGSIYYKMTDKELSNDLISIYNQYSGYWNNGAHTYLRDYAYTHVNEFWADLNSIIYMKNNSDFNYNEYKNYWNFDNQLSHIRDVELNKIKNLYNNNYTTWIKYKERGY